MSSDKQSNMARRYTEAEKAFMASYKKPTGSEIKRDFPESFTRHFPNKAAPSLQTLWNVQKRYQTTGSWNKVRADRTRTAQTSDNLGRVEQILKADPKATNRQIGEKLSISDSSASRMALKITGRNHRGGEATAATWKGTVADDRWVYPSWPNDKPSTSGSKGARSGLPE